MNTEKLIFRKTDKNNMIEYNDEELYIDDDKLEYLLSISSDLTYEDVNDKIIALFTVMKYQDAWDLMEDNINNIDYAKIKSCKYFMINPNASHFYDSIYEIGMIDDREYAYYNLLSGTLNQIFWNKYIEDNNCKSFTDVCTLVHNTYNGLSNNDIPLIKFGDYEKSLIDKYLNDDDRLDEFVYDKPAFLFPIETLYQLLDSGHFSDITKILFVISQIIDADYDDFEWLTYWKYVNKYQNQLTDYSIINNDTMLLSLVYSLKQYDLKFDIDILTSLFINSKETPYYINIINASIKVNNSDGFLKDVNISNYLNDSNMALAFLYKVCGFDVFDYEFISNVQDPTYCIYNRKTNDVLFGDNIYDGTEFANLSMWREFIDDPTYEYHDYSDFEKTLLENKFNNDKITYDNFMYGLYDLTLKIKKNNNIL